MMLRDAFGLESEADAVKSACYRAIEDGWLTPDLCEESTAKTTTEVGEYITKNI